MRPSPLEEGGIACNFWPLHPPPPPPQSRAVLLSRFAKDVKPRTQCRCGRSEAIRRAFAGSLGGACFASLAMLDVGTELGVRSIRQSRNTRSSARGQRLSLSI